MRRLAAAGIAALALSGCGDSDGAGRMIDWDFREPPTVKDVDWAKESQSVVSIEPVDSLSIKLPEGLLFRADGGIRRVFLEREHELITLTRVQSDPQTTDGAYRLARDWAERFDLPLEPLERWVRGRRSGQRDEREGVLTTARGKTVGPKGPAPSLEIHYSFDRERPSLVSLSLFWKPPRPS
jgi:hypothetical protein